MAKRDFRQAADVTFGDNNDTKPTIDESFLQVDSEIFGKIAAIDARTERIKPVSIFEIMPDPLQPRRAVPSPVRAKWNGNPVMIADLFDAWYKAVIDERKAPFPLDAYLTANESIRDRSNEIGPIETAFLEVIDLAISIRRDNLTNPITVIPLSSNLLEGNHYQLETGERRWLAFHMLYAFFDGKPDVPDERARWSKIPAREVKHLDVWRQASENTARADLNAIAKARQYALLLMDLWKHHEKKPQTFLERNRFKTERDYYAQVADRAVPHGKSEQLLNALGAKTPTAFNRCKKLLSLPSEVWTIGDDLSLAEDLLIRLAELPAQEAVNKAHQLAQKFLNQEDVALPSLRTARPTLLIDDACRTGDPLFLKPHEASLLQKFRELVSLRTGVGTVDDATKKQIRQMTIDLRRALDEIDHFIG